MHLYFKYTTGASWSDSDNWYEDYEGTQPHSAIPTYGDDVSAAQYDTTQVTIADVGVDLGSGTCDLVGLIVGFGDIVSGNFSGEGLVVTNTGSIGGGSFHGGVDVSYGSIYGGDFYGTVTVEGNGLIGSGTFHGPVLNDGLIEGGVFNAEVSNGMGSIEGGTYSPSGVVAYTALIVSGHCTYVLGTTPADPGFAGHGGTYAPVVTVTGLPTGGSGDVLGTGLL